MNVLRLCPVSRLLETLCSRYSVTISDVVHENESIIFSHFLFSRSISNGSFEHPEKYTSAHTVRHFHVNALFSSPSTSHPPHSPPAGTTTGYYIKSRKITLSYFNWNIRFPPPLLSRRVQMERNELQYTMQYINLGGGRGLSYTCGK